MVLDNLAAHKKGERVHRLLEGSGALLFEPAYSRRTSRRLRRPSASSQGAALRREKARTKEALLIEAMGRALDAITAEEAKGFFAHCGHAADQSL